MSWIRFKGRYLFSLNVALAASIPLYLIRRDFIFHFIPIIWMIVCFISDRANQWQMQGMKKLGQMNSLIIMTVFYFVFFTPFSVIYRILFRHSSFKTEASTWVKYERPCDFDQPF